MTGGGFLKHGMDVFKYNRSLRGKEGHKAFEKKDNTTLEKKPFNDDKKMSDELRSNIQLENETFNRIEIKKRIIASVITFILLLIGLYFIGSGSF